MKKVNISLLAAIIICGFWLWSYETTPLPVESLPVSTVTDTVTHDSLQWERPRFTERQNQRYQLVKKGIKKQGVTDSAVLAAMRHVPRHLFVPQQYQQYAYQNRPLPIGHEQTISQPYIVGYMTQLLDVQAGDKILEIGTGSGYQAAVLSEMTPHIYTIEIVEPLAQEAISRFKKLGYHTIKTKIGDGYKGWPAHAPFDKIILTAAPPHIPQPLLKQLAKGGTLIAPVGKTDKTQFLTKITKTHDGSIKRQRKLPVRFVPMTGKVQKN